MTDLTGQTVVITGASRGIGAATARHFAGLGAQVALLARDGAALEALAGDIGNQALALPCDMGDWAAVAAAVAATEARFGPIHVLINNAGLIDPIARLADSDPKDWGRVVDVNLKGVYHGLRAVLPGMLATGGGTVLNLSSGAATSALEGWSHYCATKAAVLALTRCADREYRDQGIRVIGLSPGTVATGMQVQIRASGINPVSRMDPSAHIPADWVAQALAYLCGPGGDAHRGTDFSLKTAEGRAEAGLS
ncbi:SDR family oxidoreductase [Ruegeria pomeroyi]|uniref:SDR family oxidoreductase n=1 Tax=Ruegeria alba TaxID=2916756 RepID=A0ABS9NZS0_9RHOB|nr:SDR family oxidoreductase [Ruegeria alba]MCE8535245.1 SDR family oxidoreductase [Ruegeria pomeroyi]MCG6559521.1 SDR family oxidoreductase [Ruegeria alba]